MVAEKELKELQKEEKVEEKKGRKRKEAFIYGNYRNYYSYRVDHTLTEDPRLAVLKKEWFEGKDCLDIGCNQGLITISIAKKFNCQRILGIDIDGALIETAGFNLRKMARKEDIDRRSGKVSDTATSNATEMFAQRTSLVPDDGVHKSGSDTSSTKEGYLSKRVSFRKENFVQSMDGCSEKYDTILCLSITKWIHLNWGDDGLITLFVKIWKLLRPGGILLLEPQPWSSYQSKRRVSETANVNFKTILLSPHLFREILLDKVGFRSAENISDNLSDSVIGFNRPIFIFQK